MVKKKSSYEDLQKDIRKLNLPAIEVWINKYSDRDYVVHLSYPEFTCICPKTGLPDFAVINIDYKPGKTCIELKSLKMYFVRYRDVGIFHEHLVNRILDDIVKACKPKWVKVEGVVNSRVFVEPGSIPYSAVTQPTPWSIKKGGILFSTDAVHITFVSPNSIKHDPAGYLINLGVIVIGRNWSSARPSIRGICTPYFLDLDLYSASTVV